MRDTMRSGDAHEMLVGVLLGVALAALSAFWWVWVHR
jgi:hypothetical protein